MDIILDKIQLIPDYAIKFAPSILLALIIFIVGRIIVRKASSGAVKATEKIPNIDSYPCPLPRLSYFIHVGMSGVIIAALSAMHINLAFLASIVAALVLALGFALQDSLGDFASGIMLALFRPFAVGDQVEIAGETGVVMRDGTYSAPSLSHAIMSLIISVGNGAVFGGTIKNYFHDGKLRLDTNIGVSYDANLDASIAAILGAVKDDPRIHKDPAPWAKVTSFG